jgi:hypothetical protein
MRTRENNLLTFILWALLPAVLLVSACKDHHSGHGQHDPAHGQGGQVSAGATAMLAPAEGARVKIIEPASDQIFSGDAIPLRFELVKGNRGQHVHAYIDGELMGMFESTSGTLTGVKPGKHTLELRVVTSDHNVELDAIDKITFVVK